MIYDVGGKSNKEEMIMCFYLILFNAEFFLDLL